MAEVSQPWWLSEAECPRCRSRLTWNGVRPSCATCTFRVRVERGVPVLAAIAEGQKAQQASFFDHADAEFETTRPHGTPALYRWLLEEKFRRSIKSLRWLLPSATVLTVCGGSGMDAEMLVRRGGQVLCSDLSVHASARALERGRLLGLAIDAVVADVEALPFADQSFDLVYVHDGLHHLQDPFAGLAEIARVARRAVSINEPARARATEIAIRLGAAGRMEEAGNVIARIDPGSVAGWLAAVGFRILRVERYGMYYKHEPGRIMRTLSTRLLFPISRNGVRTFNALFGTIGNKSTVQALREGSETLHARLP